MKLTNSILASLDAGVLIFAGCGGGAYAPKNTTKYDLENKTSFVLMDAMVQRSVTCSGIQERRLADGRLEIVANIRNRETRRIEVQVSCVFKDAQGISTGDETPWAPLMITENAQEGFRVTSMNDKAFKYTFRVRQAH